MKKHFNIILLASLMWLLPSFGMASTVVKGTVTLGNTAVQAEYVLEGMSAKLGSGFNACVPHYSVGELVVPSTITVDGTVYPVTEVSSLAFRFCTKLTRVTLPEGLTRIGDLGCLRWSCLLHSPPSEQARFMNCLVCNMFSFMPSRLQFGSTMTCFAFTAAALAIRKVIIPTKSRCMCR